MRNELVDQVKKVFTKLFDMFFIGSLQSHIHISQLVIVGFRNCILPGVWWLMKEQELSNFRLKFFILSRDCSHWRTEHRHQESHSKYSTAMTQFLQKSHQL
ncbi:uncharacterized protein LOC141594879 [Silene latifolia]|uniref:uncharacterized protein LOC141594879 n=1 Tax=Silene latifolia TaxID=37657 RepID=UPI003D7887DB